MPDNGSSESTGLRSWVSEISSPVILGKVIKSAFLPLQFPIFSSPTSTSLCGWRDLSSPARNGTWVLGSERASS